jgi:tRNA G18 (ribose-2'-O)-methylase SpoU
MLVPVLERLKSPQNVGLIVRSLRAFGCDQIAFVDEGGPWRFRKGSEAFSRKLEKDCELLHFAELSEMAEWANESGHVLVGLEIEAESVPVGDFSFPESTALLVGNEGSGLSLEARALCSANVVVPQAGNVGSLNAAVATSIALYEWSRQWSSVSQISEGKFRGCSGDYV